MAAPLSTSTVEEQRSVIRFLWSEGLKPSEIYRRMKVQYGDSCLSQGRVYEWVERFQNRRQNVSDEHRSGRPVSVASETVKLQVELFSRGHPQSLWTGGPSALRSRGTMSKNKTQTISVSTLVKKYYKIPVI